MTRVIAGPRRTALLPAILSMLLSVQPASAGEDIERARRCVAELFCIETVTSRQTLELWLESLTSQDLTVAVELVLLGTETQSHRRKAVLGTPARRRLFALPAQGKERPLFRWTFSFHPGHRPRSHDDTTVYRLPYASGRSFTVIQGPDSAFSHHGRDRYAVDWGLPEDTLVRAARGGRVIGLYQGATESGTSGEDLGRDNFVWIEHDDGTVGWYAHFQPRGLLVRHGERLEPGAPLGRAGASGYASAPHLHFQVSTPSLGDQAYETLPVRFDLGAERVGTPLEGTAYRAR